MRSEEAFKKALQEIYDSLPHFFSDYVCKEKKDQPFSLFPPNEEMIAVDLQKNMISFQKRCHTGFILILEELKTLDAPTINLQEFENKFTKAFYSLLSPQSFTQAILKVVSGTSWREALSLPPETLTLLYKGAKILFDAGRYQEASDAFSFLSWFDSSQHDFWMALGHSYFHIAEYTHAISAYEVAASILPYEPWPYIHSAACFEATGDLDQAKNYLLEGCNLEESKATPDKELIASLKIKMTDYEQGSHPLSKKT